MRLLRIASGITSITILAGAVTACSEMQDPVVENEDTSTESAAVSAEDEITAAALGKAMATGIVGSVAGGIASHFINGLLFPESQYNEAELVNNIDQRVTQDIRAGILDQTRARLNGAMATLHEFEIQRGAITDWNGTAATDLYQRISRSSTLGDLTTLESLVNPPAGTPNEQAYRDVGLNIYAAAVQAEISRYVLLMQIKSYDSDPTYVQEFRASLLDKLETAIPYVKSELARHINEDTFRKLKDYGPCEDEGSKWDGTRMTGFGGPDAHRSWPSCDVNVRGGDSCNHYTWSYSQASNWEVARTRCNGIRDRFIDGKRAEAAAETTTSYGFAAMLLDAWMKTRDLMHAPAALNLNTLDLGGVDFGGMYGSSYPNPVTGTRSCPTGFTPQKVTGSGVDADVFACTRPWDGTTEPLVDFGGMFGGTEDWNGNTIWKNPITQGASCPADYSASPIAGNAQDYQLSFCWKRHAAHTVAPYLYGGAFAYQADYQNYRAADGAPNSLTSGPSTSAGATCPVGFTPAAVHGSHAARGTAEDRTLAFCYKANTAQP
jgi:hypothetical protein